MWIKQISSNFSTEKKVNNKKYELSNKWPKDNTQNTNQIYRPSIIWTSDMVSTNILKSKKKKKK